MEQKPAKSNKTEAVMRLLTGKKVATNPSLSNNLKDEVETPKIIEQPQIIEQPKVEEPKPQVIEQPKVEEPKPQVIEQPKVEEPKPQVIEQPRVEEPKPQVIEQPKVEEPKPQVIEQPKVEEPKPQTSVVEIDVTGELITELMPQVLQRFNCCQCPICYADAVAEAGNRVPTIKVKINGKDDMKVVEKMKDQHRKDVMMILVRLALERKPLPKHD